MSALTADALWGRPVRLAVKEYERKQLLERLDREGSTVGRRVPERLEIQGEPFDLKAFLFEVKRHETVPAEIRERVRELKRVLRRERLERREVVEEGQVPREEGEELVEEILGIERALNALDDLDRTDLEAETAAQEAADQKRWLSFLKQVLGREDGRRSRP